MKKIVILLFAIGYLLLVPVEAFAQTATLSLEPVTGTYNQGCAFSLNIKLNTSGAETDGADAILTYDATRFAATSITKGGIYPDFPGNNIDTQTGKITVSGLAAVSSPFSGTGLLASVNFTVLSTAPTGATQIKFDFDPNEKSKTTDSNVVQRGTVADILNSVVDGNYTIGTGSCAQATATPSATLKPRGKPLPEGSLTPEQSQLPEGGTAEFTSTIAIVGGVLTVLGILGLALL